MKYREHKRLWRDYENHPRKITPEMLKDWRSEGGWRDFNGQIEEIEGYDHREFPHDGGLLIISYEKDIPDGFAIEAKIEKEQTIKRRYCPIWIRDRPPPTPNPQIILADPEFSLEEVAAGEELITQMDLK